MQRQRGQATAALGDPALISSCRLTKPDHSILSTSSGLDGRVRATGSCAMLRQRRLPPFVVVRSCNRAVKRGMWTGGNPEATRYLVGAAWRESRLRDRRQAADLEFARPVIILKKYNQHSFFVLPLTPAVRTDKPSNSFELIEPPRVGLAPCQTLQGDC